MFFNGLRRFYADEKFQKAGTDDFERAMETASGRSLTRFFDRWIHGDTLPTLRYSSTIRPGEVIVQFDQDSAQIFDVPVTVTIQYQRPAPEGRRRRRHRGASRRAAHPDQGDRARRADQQGFRRRSPEFDETYNAYCR